jgi:hypothetical protein
MNWKFWEKTQKTDNPSQPNNEKLPRPKSIPEPVGRYLVVHMGKDPDWVWNLQAAIRTREEKPNTFYFRVFDPSKASASRISVRDYTSLEKTPQLILFEGWYDKKLFEVHMEEKGKPTQDSKAA